MSISEKVLAKIGTDNIRPLARWKFVIKNIALWISGLFVVLLGALGVSTFLHIITNNDWDIYKYLGRSFVEHFFKVFPYVWVVALAIFIIIAYVLFKKTKTGYRHTIRTYFASLFLSSAILGLLLFSFGVGETIDTFLINNFVVYANLPHNKAIIWNRPEAGLIAGTISDIIDGTTFILTDFLQNDWTVIESDTAWIDGVTRSPGTKIRVIGAYEDNGVFIAKEVRQWEKTKKNVK